MSAIDSIWHELIGQLDGVPIYRLLETPIGGFNEFGDCRKGDLMLGGGGGETPALRISMPEALEIYTGNMKLRNDFDRDRYDNEVQEFWGLNHGYNRIRRYKKLGYRPGKDGSIESWLACQVLHYVVGREPERYKKYMDTVKLLSARDWRIHTTLVGKANPEWVKMADDWFANIRGRTHTDRFKVAEAELAP